MSTDAIWTRFVRNWREVMRYVYLPRCSRSEPCCEHECANVAEHFARTGDTRPDERAARAQSIGVTK